MRNNRVTQKDILFLSISMFVMVITWIGFNLYHTWATSTISADLQTQIVPIDPNFDTGTIHQLESRKNISPFSQETNIPVASDSATITPELEPIASDSAEQQTPEVTPAPEINPNEEPVTGL